MTTDHRPLISISQTGSSRIAILLWRWAIKIPRMAPADRRARGRRGNRMERDAYRLHGNHWTELCPVVWADRFGWVLIMPRVRMMTPEEFYAFCDGGAYPDHYFPDAPAWPDTPSYEDKPDDWGYLKGRPVVIDYAKDAHS